MLIYNNRSFWRMMLQVTGSVVWKRENMIAGFILAAISVVFQWMVAEDIPHHPTLSHHYGMHALGVIVAFAIVFRTNLGWHRYWEAVTQLHIMYSKWADAYSQFYAFATTTVLQEESKGSAGNKAKIARVKEGALTIESDFILLSAMAADRLAHGDTERMSRRAEIASWSQQVVERSAIRHSDLTGATRLPQLVPLVTGGEEEGVPSEASRQTLKVGWNTTYVIKRKVEPEREKILEQSPDRANTVMHWILFSLAKISKDIDIAPPIQSRIYQELSNGMLGFFNSLKIADVPFPFPYAQLLTFMLVMYSLFIPLYVTVFTSSMIVSPLMTFLLFQGIWGVNEVAKELENPFGTDINDINILDFHGRFLDAINDTEKSNPVDIRTPLATQEPAPDADQRSVVLAVPPAPAAAAAASGGATASAACAAAAAPAPAPAPASERAPSEPTPPAAAIVPLANPGGDVLAKIEAPRQPPAAPKGDAVVEAITENRVHRVQAPRLSLLEGGQSLSQARRQRVSSPNGDAALLTILDVDSVPPTDDAVEERLRWISARVEQHLAKMSKDLDALTAVAAAHLRSQPRQSAETAAPTPTGARDPSTALLDMLRPLVPARNVAAAGDAAGSRDRSFFD